MSTYVIIINIAIWKRLHKLLIFYFFFYTDILEHNYRNLQKRSYYNARSNQCINPLLINIRNRFINWCYGILRKSSNAHIFHRFQESQFKYASRYTPLRNGLHKIFNQIQSRQSNIFGTTGVSKKWQPPLYLNLQQYSFIQGK